MAASVLEAARRDGEAHGERLEAFDPEEFGSGKRSCVGSCGGAPASNFLNISMLVGRSTTGRKRLGFIGYSHSASG